jgi:ferric iron reductase protein FhuF
MRTIVRARSGAPPAPAPGTLTADTARSHPLAATLGRGKGRVHLGWHLGAALGATDDPRWIPVTGLLDDARTLERALMAVGREVGSTRRDVQASLLLESYAWRLILPLAGALVAESRIPMPGSDGVALRLADDGLPDAIRLLQGRFVALPEDPDTEHPDADVVRDRSSFDLCFASVLIAHFEPFVQTLHSASGRSRRALWRTVADRTATALLYAGLACDRMATANVAAERTLAHPPLDDPPRYTKIGDRAVHLRHGCCLWWRTAAATTCLTCPLRVASGGGDGPAPCSQRDRRTAADELP